jgi:import receptor subunit TOM22
MVKVEIVEEKDAQLPGNSPYASSSSSRTSSSASLSSVSSQLSADESIFDRIAALVDIVPPTTRHAISSRLATSASLIKRGGKLVGNIVWIITTSALLVGLPLALSLEDEAKIVAQEKEMLAQQQGAQQVRDHPPLLITFLGTTLCWQQMLSSGSYSPASSSNNQSQKGLVPPGF